MLADRAKPLESVLQSGEVCESAGCAAAGSSPGIPRLGGFKIVMSSAPYTQGQICAPLQRKKLAFSIGF